MGIRRKNISGRLKGQVQELLSQAKTAREIHQILNTPRYQISLSSIYKIRSELKQKEALHPSLGFPYQGKRRELDREAVPEAEGRSVESTAALAQTLKEHWDILAFLAEKLARGLYQPRLTWWPVEGPQSIPNDFDALQAVYWLRAEHMEGSNCRDEVKADWRYYRDLLVHMRVEDSKWEGNMSAAKMAVSDYYTAEYLLARKIEEEAEKRTGLPYDNNFNYGLTSHFSYTLFSEAMIGSSKSEYEIKGLALWFGGRGLAKVKEGQEGILPRVKEVHRDLIEEVKEWPEFERIPDLYDSAAKAITPLKESLTLISKRKTFKARCPSCP